MVGDSTRERNAFLKKHIENENQLRRWFPIRYIDNTRETGADPALHDKHAVIVGTLLKCEEKEMRSRPGTYLRLTMTDRMSYKMVTINVFTGGYSERFFRYLVGHTIIASGKLNYDKFYGVSLSYETLEEFTESSFKMIPVLSRVRGITPKNVSSYIEEAVEAGEKDTVPEHILQKYNITGISHALKMINLPETPEDVVEGKKRILFDDLFYMASRFALSEREHAERTAPQIKKDFIMRAVVGKLPFSLTNGQMETVDGIVAKMKAGQRVNALVQGDVGCGKTMTAFLPMIAAAENGIQSCLVAPTKILAEQHFEKLSKILEETGIRAELFTGEPKTKKTKKKFEDLSEGEILIAVGTHALLNDKLEFNNLGLLVVDEEQKFGVEAREAILNRVKDLHYISMSATPIPRTLAAAVYGSTTDIYSIKELPGGRKKIITQYDDGQRRKACVDFILKQKQQVYVVCPAIEDEENELKMMNTRSAKAFYQALCPDAEIATLDGAMKPADSEKVINAFKAGEIDILISTTVVEVGVDVPNATLMIIENAERFGLSQLHQLRGRVGRGDKQSYCLLISDKSPAENPRINTLLQTTDGFEIARIDLTELRRSGDLFGTAQSGMNVYVEEMLLYKPTYDRILADARTLDSSILEAHVKKMISCEVRNHKKVIVFTKVA